MDEEKLLKLEKEYQRLIEAEKYDFASLVYQQILELKETENNENS